MAILLAGLLGDSRNKVGNIVTYRMKGQNVARVHVEKVKNPQSDAQMRQRAKLINLVAAYRANMFWMKYGAFENKQQKWSDYNAFVSANTNLSPVFLQKEQVNAGAGIVQPFTISRGSLGAIELNFDNENEAFISNLYIGDNEIGSTTTIGSISAALIDNNNGIRKGDQLSVIAMFQRTQNGNVPVILTRAYELIIDTTSTREIGDVIPDLQQSTVGDSDSNAISWGGLGSTDLGGCAFILSRDEGGSIKVSTQILQLTPAMRDFELSYRSSAAFQRFIASYGGGGMNFLSGGYYNATSQNIILGAQIVSYREGTRPVVNVGDQSYQLSNTLGDIIIQTNEEIGTVNSVTLYTSSAGDSGANYVISTGITVSGNLITLASGSLPPISGAYIRRIVLSTANGMISAEFTVITDSGDPGDITG